MIKFIVINVNYERNVRFRFELPENKATEEFLTYFRGHSNLKVNYNRHWLIYYNARESLLRAVRASGNRELLERFRPFEQDPLAIGIMLDEIIVKRQPE